MYMLSVKSSCLLQLNSIRMSLSVSIRFKGGRVNRLLILLVSAGFDAALNDPIGQCNVTPAGYGQMTHMLKGLADGKIVIALEGGYNLDSIAVSAVACMNVLLGEAPEAIQDGLVPKKECFETVELVKSIQKKYWRCFGN